ncbi:MAG: hypothetical protein U9O78_00020, partial [Patescibacteria group bacterium]|nr:hypothetical protein [Patescibacteria group bacterium]
VKAYDDVSLALNKWSDKRGRDPKYQLINQGVLARLHPRISFNDTQGYLDKLEANIIYFLVSFNNGLKAKCGQFAGDDVVKYDIYDRSSYKGFIELYDSRKKIPLEKFWKDNDESLDELIKNQELKKYYEKFHDSLVKIHSDRKKADSFRVNKTIGDAVIAVDAPKKYIIVTIDRIFKYLADSLNKSLLVLPKL